MAEHESRAARVAKYFLGLFAAYVFGVATPLTVSAVKGEWGPWEETPLERTNVSLFPARPGSAIASNLRLTRPVTGICTEGSLNPVPGAVKCSTDGGLSYPHDPCFGDYGTEVLCVAHPWAEVATPFRVRRYFFDRPKGNTVKTYLWDPGSTDPFPVRPYWEAAGANPPWAVELDNGMRCLRLSGARYTGHVRPNYECSRSGSDGHSGGWVLGDPNRREEVWRAVYAPPGEARSEQVAVRVAWF